MQRARSDQKDLTNKSEIKFGSMRNVFTFALQTKTNTMKTLKEISHENLTNAVTILGENRRLLTIAEVMKDKNKILKLTFQREQLKAEMDYHRIKLSE